VNGTIKFLIGGITTSLMAMAAHSWFDTGARFVDRLQSEGETALGNAGGAGTMLAFEREPSLRRIAILSGPADAATRARLLAAIRAVPGVADARWADNAVATAPEASASAEAVAACQTQVDSAIAGKTIQFATGSAAIAPESVPLIDALAAVLGPCEGTTVAVSGHTDASGNAATNQSLSEARANSVVAALTAKGVPAPRLTASGFGSSRPKVEGRGAAADAANRRIEFSVASAAAPAPQQGN
jgi:OmpA-OmpF porin, OOP family